MATVAVVLARNGLPWQRFLTTRDRDEQLLLVALALRAKQVQDIADQNLAVAIGNHVAKVWR